MFSEVCSVYCVVFLAPSAVTELKHSYHYKVIQLVFKSRESVKMEPMRPAAHSRLPTLF